MSEPKPLIERAKELRDLCRDRNRRVWFCSSGLMERTEPVLTDLITDLVKRTAKIVELEGDVERLRANQRDLEAERNGWRNRARQVVVNANADLWNIKSISERNVWCSECCYIQEECACNVEASE